MRFILACLSLAILTPALAQDSTPPLPHDRPASMEEAPPIPLPRKRPDALTPATPAEAPEEAAPQSPASPAVAPDAAPAEPVVPRVYQSACPAVLDGLVEATAVPPIRDGQCGLQSPLAVTGVVANGRAVPFEGAPTLSCAMATALPEWIGEVDSYLKAHDNTTIKAVITSTSYSCRNVDNAKVGNLSFHAFADALDVIGFRLEDGRTLMLAPAWNGTAEQGKDVWRFAHDAACTHFTTVLGPDADQFHLDNLHIDVGCHGKTCTARLCQ